MTLNSLVTVYMPTHNRSDIIERAINSVLNQTYKNFELIVIDDGSTDNTEDILRRYSINFDNFSYFSFSKSNGACISRNKAIALASGQYITGIDDDDEWLPERLQAFVNQKELLEKHSFIYHNDFLVDSELNIRSKYHKAKFFTMHEFEKKNIVGNQIFTKTEIMRNYLFDKNLPSAQDYDLFFRIAYGENKLPIKNNIYTQILYINHGGNQITKSSKKFTGYLKFYQKNKGLMSKSSRKYQLYSLYNIRAKSMSIKVFYKLLTIRNLIRLARGV